MPPLAGVAGQEQARGRALSVAHVLQQYTPAFVRRHPRQAAPQVQSTLAKLSLCRTTALGGRQLHCPSCAQDMIVYNSCGDRHCPQCAGARGSAWVDQTAELCLPGVPYFQVVFTLPDLLSPLVLGHRRLLYALLLRSAWQALREVLHDEQGIDAAAVLVLHTWNQELDHHPHVHALVPGGGPSLDGQRWRSTRHPQHRRRTKPYLADHRRLGQTFREHFCRHLKRWHAQGRITFEPPRLPGVDEPDFAEWVERLAETFNVFIAPPPENSQPTHLVQYLARYLTGGPISERRLIAHEDQHVTFWARSKHRQRGNRSRPFTLSGVEFVRRWSLHILPPRFTKTRRYGGFSCRRQAAYLQRCRQLLGVSVADDASRSPALSGDEPAETSRRCPRCQTELVCVADSARPAWRDLFADWTTCPLWYQPRLAMPRLPTVRIRSPALSTPESAACAL